MEIVFAASPSVIPSNPFVEKNNLQYQAPRFDLIKDERFKPAFDIALKEHDAEIQKIVNNPAHRLSKIRYLPWN